MHGACTQQPQTTGITYCRRQPPATAPYHTALDDGPRESIEQIEATGLRYMVTERANNMAVGSWRSVGGGGIAGDFMRPFTKDFWNRKAARRRARTLEVLRTYGDSITARRKETIIK